ncbi:RNA polymerase sigma-54 factor [Pelotomaculum schinkii]|uniref:RNA polymerase sigma-54 factor n=1 Tax=Pelotomaculum schinkii TaxID=78350 RepID=A0A4Y7R6I3_9FIRM|nr:MULTISPECIES: RNA polymerase factor sigma-54 [Pelotomaculum]TEB04342.1 RNA polymerase sigma-54 factor [Pelotomaculum schinkii]TEB13834.1 RNA polymerase sigma-54 factor [Pelotomaculum sp. FP]
MRMGYGLNVEQSQKLIMTPELRQAITVLQLSSLELSTYIEQQFEENPLLELREEEVDREQIAAAEDKQVEPADERKEYDLDWEEYFHDSSDLGMVRQERVQDQQDYGYENFLFKTPTLSEHLLFQLNMSSCQFRDRIIGEYLIGNIDENGYLRVSLREVASKLNINESEAYRALNLIQSFDPIGVGARDLVECLLIQVNQLGIENDILKELIKEHLVDLSKGKVNRIAQDLGITVQEVQKAADILKTLDPKPGRNFANPNDTRYIVPDIFLEKVDGEYIILVNDGTIPRITINAAYRSVLSKDKNFDTRTRRFVESKLNAAAWLIRSIEQRRLTLYKVAKCLVELQRDFLDHGVKYLKPLNLKKVAALVNLHESTVSRATSNKYIQTPQGVFDMKYFFSTGLNNSAGTTTSAESIKKMLQEIVAAEDARLPLDDQKISELFMQKGIRISRRTVAKYRDELNIPAIRKRKRY